MSLLCGVGFTMSLFIGALAFPGADLQAQNQVRLGVVLATLLSAGAGMAVLGWAGGHQGRAQGTPGAPSLRSAAAAAARAAAAFLETLPWPRSV